MLKELSNDPLQAAIAKIERQHEEDKQGIWNWITKLEHAAKYIFLNNYFIFLYFQWL